MKTTRQWVPYVAMAVLVGLLITAFLARGHGHAPMSITPASASPGDSITVRFAEPQATDDEWMFQADGKLFLLENDQWVEVEPGSYASIVVLSPPRTSLNLTLPREVEPGRYRVCVDAYDDSQPDDVADLPKPQPLCTQLEVQGG